MPPYIVSRAVAWADTDPNAHLRHSVYSDFATHARVTFFAKLGFSLNRLARHQIGPILLKEETVFLREVVLNDTVEVDVELVACTDDYANYTIQHSIRKSNRKEAARVTVSGAWVHLLTRKLVSPPPDLKEKVLDVIPRATGFSVVSRDRYRFV